MVIKPKWGYFWKLQTPLEMKVWRPLEIFWLNYQAENYPLTEKTKIATIKGFSDALE